jgi:hypothetical protein
MEGYITVIKSIIKIFILYNFSIGLMNFKLKCEREIFGVLMHYFKFYIERQSAAV